MTLEIIWVRIKLTIMFTKILYLFAVGFCFFWLSCSENPSVDEEIEWKGDFHTFEHEFEQKQDMETTDDSSVLYLKGESSPFSGLVERNSTERLSVDNYEDGLLDGLSVRKSADGSWVEANYKSGKLHGRMTFYDGNGKVRSEMIYENVNLVPQSSDLAE